MRRFLLAWGLLASVAAPSNGQQYEARPAPVGEVVLPYLQGSEVNFRDILGPPPALGSLSDQLDIGQVQGLQQTASAERFASALQDSDFLFPRFSDALGLSLDRTHLPRTIHLLYRAIRSASLVSSAGKTAYARPRPFQRVQLGRVCDFDRAPAPADADPGDRTSYPSGHTTAGWSTALVLAQVAPERQAMLFDRARDYGLSRVICGVHYPSDVEAGRAVATAIVTRLMSEPAFRRDLDCARAEYQAARTGRGRNMAQACGVTRPRTRQR